jgi:hypothetical protein
MSDFLLYAGLVLCLLGIASFCIGGVLKLCGL